MDLEKLIIEDDPTGIPGIPNVPAPVEPPMIYPDSSDSGTESEFEDEPEILTRPDLIQ